MSGKEPPLLWKAASNRDLEKVMALLKEKKIRSKINEKDKTWGHTALSVAAFKGFLNIVKELVKHGADPKTRDNKNFTPLTSAAQRGHLDVVEYLVENCRVPVDAQSKYRTTATFLAFTFDHVEVAKYLMQQGGKKKGNEAAMSVLMSAASEGSQHSVKYLIENGDDVNEVNKHKESALFMATTGGHAAVVQLLLVNGADINQQNLIGDTALHIAAYENFKDTTEPLLKHHPDITITNEKKKRAVDIAVQKKHREIVKQLENEELYIACMENDQDRVQKAPDFNIYFADGSTPLITACKNQHADLCKFLLGKAANIHQRSRSGKSVLDEAVETKNTQLVATLLQQNPKIMSTDIGNAALKLAHELKHAPIVAVLQDALPGNDELTRKVNQLPDILSQAVEEAKQRNEPTQKLEECLHETNGCIRALKENPMPTENIVRIIDTATECVQLLDQKKSGTQELVTDLTHAIAELNRSTSVEEQLRNQHNVFMKTIDEKHEDIKKAAILHAGNPAEYNLKCTHPVLKAHQEILIDELVVDIDLMERLHQYLTKRIDEVKRYDMKGRAIFLLVCIDKAGGDGVLALTEALENSYNDGNNLLGQQLRQSLKR